MAGLDARPAAPGDYDLFTRFFAELRTGNPVPARAKWESELLPQTIFLEQAGQPVAYGLSSPIGALGYVMHVVVAPEARGRRVGDALLRALARRLRSANCTRWCLNVKTDNVPALRLYDRFGLSKAYASTSLRVAWSLVNSVPAGPAGVKASTLDGADEGPVERRFGLPPGTLASRRARGGRVLLELSDGSEPGALGVAVFNPSFPCAHPLRLARPDLAGPMFRALHAHARPEHDFVLTVVEADPDLDALLRRAGAQVRFELLHLEGTIPDAPT